MMVRLLAFAVHASDRLQFTTGLSTEGEPDLWQRSPTGEIELWIDVGLPDEKHLRKACGRAQQVIVYAYGGSKAGIWWQRLRDSLGRLDRLSVFELSRQTTVELAALAQRGMNLGCLISDDQRWQHLAERRRQQRLCGTGLLAECQPRQAMIRSPSSPFTAPGGGAGEPRPAAGVNCLVACSGRRKTLGEKGVVDHLGHFDALRLAGRQQIGIDQRWRDRLGLRVEGQ